MIREAIIARCVAGKRTLDVGSLGQTEEYRLWDVLSEHAGALTGIDLDDAALAAVTHGTDLADAAVAADPRILRGNMESDDLGQSFEVIVAGDVIEHMSNPGRFLDNCRRHLEPGGSLVITTPNAKWPTVFLRPNPTHALWHDRHTLRHLLERHGYRVTELRTYCGNKPHYSLPKRLLAWRQSLLAIATPSTRAS